MNNKDRESEDYSSQSSLGALALYAGASIVALFATVAVVNHEAERKGHTTATVTGFTPENCDKTNPQTCRTIKTDQGDFDIPVRGLPRSAAVPAVTFTEGCSYELSYYKNDVPLATNNLAFRAKKLSCK